MLRVLIAILLLVVFSVGPANGVEKQKRLTTEQARELIRAQVLYLNFISVGIQNSVL